MVLRMYLVYNTVVRLCQFFCCGGKVNVVRIPYTSHNRFSKILQTFFVKKMIPYKTYVQEDQLFLALYGSTTIQSLLFLKKIENFVWFPKEYLLGFFILDRNLFLFLINTLLLNIPLLSLTDRRNHRRRNEYTRFAWAGGTFFPVVLLCQFLVLAGNRFWFYILTYAT